MVQAAAKQQIKAPLRLVTSTSRVEIENEDTGRKVVRTMEHLECGHQQIRKSDIIGPGNKIRRRCERCKYDPE